MSGVSALRGRLLPRGAHWTGGARAANPKTPRRAAGGTPRRGPPSAERRPADSSQSRINPETPEFDAACW